MNGSTPINKEKLLCLSFGSYLLDMKPELLEHLIRLCVREVLNNVREADDEFKGAAAPPADGQGTADQPAVPKDKPEEPQAPEEPQTPEPTNLKGNVFINPRDKSDLKPLKLTPEGSDAQLDRELHRFAAGYAGSQVRIAISTMRMVKEALRNPGVTVYLYLRKYDPSSEEVYLVADRSLYIAKDNSITPAELTGASVSQPSTNDFQPLTASPDDYAQNMTAGGRTQVPRIDEQVFRKIVKKMVNEILNRK